MTSSVHPKTGMPILDYGNISLWLQKLKALLLSKGLYNAIDEDSRPASVERREDFESVDKQALGILMLHISDTLLPMFEACITARQAWEIVLSMGSTHSQISVSNLEDRHYSFQLSANEDVCEGFLRYRIIRADLNRAGVRIPDLDLLRRFIRCLPPAFEPYRIAWLADLTRMTIDSFQIRLLEAKTDVEHHSSGHAALLVGHGAGGGIRCDWCDKTGHSTRDCRSLANVGPGQVRRLKTLFDRLAARLDDQDPHPARDDRDDGHRGQHGGRGGMRGGHYTRGAGRGGRGGNHGSREERYQDPGTNHGPRHIALLTAFPTHEELSSEDHKDTFQAATTACSEYQDALTEVTPCDDDGTDDEPLAFSLVSTNELGLTNDDWVLDSACTQHMTPTRDAFTSFVPFRAPTELVVGKKGVSVSAEGVGTIDMMFSTPCGRDALHVQLHNVYYVPNAPANLMSVEELSEHCDVVFKKRTCKVYHPDGDGTLLTLVHKVGKLHVIRQVSPPSAPASLVSARAPETAEMWHRRLGHTAMSTIRRAVAGGMVTGINLPASAFKTPDGVCDPCVRGKDTRSPFYTDPKVASKPLELVHMDVWGPAPIPAMEDKCRYLVTFLDDYSGYSRVVPVADKTCVGRAIRATLMEMESDCGHQVCAVRSDNGTEFVNAALTTWYESRGIIHQRTVPYNPEMNGSAERLNRTLFDKVRCMLRDTQLPTSLWARAVQYASVVRNVLPCAGKPKTPWELFFAETPDVSHMRVFGCPAYVHVPQQRRANKLADRACKGVFVGYGGTSSAYVVLVDGRILQSRDVTFDESSPTPAAPVAPPAAPTAIGVGTPRTPPLAVTTASPSMEHAAGGADAPDDGDSDDDFPAHHPRRVHFSPRAFTHVYDVPPELALDDDDDDLPSLPSLHLTLGSDTVDISTLDSDFYDSAGSADEVDQPSPATRPAPRYPARGRQAPGEWWMAPRSQGAALAVASTPPSAPGPASELKAPTSYKEASHVRP